MNMNLPAVVTPPSIYHGLSARKTFWEKNQKQHHMKILSFLYFVHTQDNLFDAVEFQQRYRKNPFALGGVYLTPFSQYVP